MNRYFFGKFKQVCLRPFYALSTVVVLFLASTASWAAAETEILALVVRSFSSSDVEQRLQIRDLKSQKVILESPPSEFVIRISASPDGRLLTYTYITKRAQHRINILDLDTLLVRPIGSFKGIGGITGAPSFSPSCEKILFSASMKKRKGEARVKSDFKIFEHILADKLTRLVPVDHRSVHTPNYLNETNFVYQGEVGKNQSEIFATRRNIRETTVRRISAKGANASSPRVSKNGSSVSYILGNNYDILRLFDLETSKAFNIGFEDPIEAVHWHSDRRLLATVIDDSYNSKLYELEIDPSSGVVEERKLVLKEQGIRDALLVGKKRRICQ